jgi:hypothetical protein
METSDQLRQAVESQHAGNATLFYVAQVQEMLGAQTLWQGAVHVFDLEGNAKATRAYAWSGSIPCRAASGRHPRPCRCSQVGCRGGAQGHKMNCGFGSRRRLMKC